MERRIPVIETSKTKTITLGKDSVKDLIFYLSDYEKNLKANPDWEWNSLEEINKIENYISLLKTIPWNEGGYCQDELE